MSINYLLMDSMEHYNVPTAKYTSQNSGTATINTTGSQWGGRCLDIDLNNTVTWNFLTMFGSVNNIGVTDRPLMGLWFYIDATSWPTTYETPIACLGLQSPASLGSGIKFSITPGRQIHVTQGNAWSGSAHVATFPCVMSLRTWYLLEFYVYQHATAGQWQGWLNGIGQAGATGVNTAQPGGYGYEHVMLGNVYGSIQSYTAHARYSSLYLAARDPGTSFTSGHRVVNYMASGNGVGVAWTPVGAASNYQAVNDIDVPPDPNSDDSFNKGSNAGDTDLFVYPTSGFSYTSAMAVQINMLGTDPTTTNGTHLNGTAAPAVYKSGITYVDPTSYQDDTIGVLPKIYQKWIYQQNPADGTAWTPANINLTQFGYSRTGTNPVGDWIIAQYPVEMLVPTTIPLPVCAVRHFFPQIIGQ